MITTMTKSPFILLLSAVFAAGTAQADVLDLDIGGASLYSLGNFNSFANSVAGSVVVAGNMNATSYSINGTNKDAYGANGYSLVVGGNLSYVGGSINNGSYYVGGNSTTFATGLSSATKATTSPVSFADTSAALKTTSANLANVAANATSKVQYGGLTLTGNSSNVQVFDLTAATLASVNYFKFSNLTVDDSLILNISGKNVVLTGGYDAFSSYNVLYNFYEASTVTLNGVNLVGGVLAPLATVSGGGKITGEAVVGNFGTGVTIASGNGFAATNVASYVSAVPEPETYAMLLAGLGLVGFAARRRKNKAAA